MTEIIFYASKLHVATTPKYKECSHFLVVLLGHLNLTFHNFYNQIRRKN